MHILSPLGGEMDYALLKRLTETVGPSGCENAVWELMAETLREMGDRVEIKRDPLGNLIAHIQGDGPRVLLTAHMDEVGLIVSKIEPQGFLRVMTLGGIDPRVLYGQTVVVHGRSVVRGVVGTEPPHLRSGDSNAGQKSVSIDDCFIDLGLPPEKVEDLVRIGDVITYTADSWETETSFFGKALDDRVGVFSILEAVKRIDRIDCDLFVVGSVQEENGLRGAGPSAFAIQPHVALAVEGTFAIDVPGPPPPANLTKTTLGLGPEIRMTDRAMVADRDFVRFLCHLAEENNIPHQVIVKKFGGTDAAPIQTTAGGTKVSTISVPVRYIHAPVGVVNKSDVENTVKLISAFLREAQKSVEGRG